MGARLSIKNYEYRLNIIGSCFLLFVFLLFSNYSYSQILKASDVPLRLGYLSEEYAIYFWGGCLVISCFSSGLVLLSVLFSVIKRIIYGRSYIIIDDFSVQVPSLGGLKKT